MEPNEIATCASPTTPDLADELPHRRFLWRIIPIALLYVYGGLALVDGAIGTYLIFGGCSVMSGDHRHFASPIQRLLILFAQILLIPHGVAVIIAARTAWQSRWRRSMIAILVAVGIAIIAYIIAGPIVDQLPWVPLSMPLSAP